LRSFVSARCATSDKGPKALFDHATTWLSTLARLVASVRAEASEQLCFQIVEGIEVGLHGRLNGLLEVRAGSRFSDLERLRTSPAKVTGLELERALRRVGDVRQLGVGDLDLSALPGNRVLALARYGMTSPTVGQLDEDAPPVAGVGNSSDQTSLFESVEPAGNAGRGQHEQPVQPGPGEPVGRIGGPQRG
jgi:hypothetical protein